MFFMFQVFQGPGFSGSIFSRVQVFLGPGFSGSESRVRVQGLGPGSRISLLSVTFTAKLELVFVLTFENAFLSFHFKANRNSIGSSRKRF